MASWGKIKREYVCSEISLTELAHKHGVSLSGIKRRSTEEGWVQLRKEAKQKIDQKAIQKYAEKVADDEADRLVRLLNVSDRLLEQLEQASSELDRRLTVKRTRKKTTTTGKDENNVPMVVEDTLEEEVPQEVVTLIDRKGLRALAATLKDLQTVALAGKVDDNQNGVAVEIVFGDEDDEELSE